MVKQDKLGTKAIGYSYFFPYDDNKEKAIQEIHRGLDPIYKQFDYIYAIDGRYINYECDRDYSYDWAKKALDKYPNIVHDECKPMFQTDKRQRYLDLAGKDNMNWLMVWDTDDILYPSPECQNWERFWKNLLRYSKKFPDYQLFKMKSWIPDIKTWRKAHNVNQSNTWIPYIRLHKNPGGQRYCLYCHYWWCPRDASDEDLILQRRGLFISDHTIDGVRFTTNSFLRGEVQLDTRDNWAWNNIQEEQRRLYILQQQYIWMGHDKGKPDWIPDKLDGYWRYDKVGRPISKICEDDGSPPKPIVPKINKK